MKQGEVFSYPHFTDGIARALGKQRSKLIDTWPDGEENEIQAVTCELVARYYFRSISKVHFEEGPIRGRNMSWTPDLLVGAYNIQILQAKPTELIVPRSVLEERNCITHYLFVGILPGHHAFLYCYKKEAVDQWELVQNDDGDQFRFSISPAVQA